MFEKLLSLLLHAKGGAVATVFVLGTTGALVTATVDNGLTTITIAQASSTTAGSETTTPGGSTTANTTVTEAILALFNRTSADEDPTATATGKGCSDEAHARNEQKKRVNDASKSHRQEVATLGKAAARTDDNKKAVKDADTAIKDIRQAADKAIHGTFDCDKDEDEDVDDEDTDEDEDEDDEDDTTSTTTTTGPSVAFSGDDAKMIADMAIAAMDFEVTDLKAKLTAPTTTTDTTNTSDKAKPDKSNNENKGTGNGKSKGQSRDSDSEDDD